MSKQDRQMNVPIRTKNNEEVQTDVNLIGSGRSSDTLQLASSPQQRAVELGTQESWMIPFSDHYLLDQLNGVIQQLQSNGNDFKTAQVVDDLSNKIHGLLARELKVNSTNGGYYDVLLDQEKQILKSQIKYGNVQRKIEGYLKKIAELERQIGNLRGSLKIYQGAAEENELYKQLFKDLKDSTSKKQSDFQKTLNEKILPKIKQFEISLSQISKNSNKERSSKQKAAIARYAQELDTLSKTRDLEWGPLSNSAAVFFTSLEHLNSDDWVQERLGLANSYQELRNRHTAVLSLVSKNIDELLLKDSTFKNLKQVSELIGVLEQEKDNGFETSLVNGWIGLGVIHRVNGFAGSQSSEQIEKLRSLLVLFQQQIRKISQKYPEIQSQISQQLHQILSLNLPSQLAQGASMQWIKQILIKQPQIIHVDNVYRYYNKNDEQSAYYLRILVKALVDQLKRIHDGHKIDLQLSQPVLEILGKQVLDDVNVEDVAGIFKTHAKVEEVGVVVEKPTYLTTTETVGVPLKQEKAVIVSDTTHFAVNLQQGLPYRKQIPYEYSKTEVVQMPTKLELAYAVPTKIIEQVVKFDERVNIVKVPIEQEKHVSVLQEKEVETQRQVMVTQDVVKEINVAYNTVQTSLKEVQVQKQIPKNIFKQISKVMRVQQVIPKVYREEKYEIVEKPVHHVVIQKQIEFVEREKAFIQRVEVAKPIEVIVERPVYQMQHCQCQKPEAVQYTVEKPIYKDVPKQIYVQKCHFVQPNVVERIVEVPKITQVPIYKEVIRQQAVIVEKPIPLRTVEEKLKVVDRQIPYFVEHFTPVEVIVEKPVIVRDVKHVPVQVQQPVPVYIEKIVPKIVQVYRDKIVEKIVEVPRVEIIEKIVEKIVTIPRIVEKIVTVTQIVEVPVFIQTPVLEIIQIPVQKLVTDIIQKQKIIEVKSEVIKIETVHQVVDKIEYEQVKKIVQIQPETYPEIVVEKIVRIVQEKPVEIYIDRFVDRVVEIKEVVPVENRVEIPIQIQVPVQIISQKPVFYQQPVVQVDVQRVQREKIVEVEREVIKIQKIETPILKIEKQIVQIPGETIILKQPQLHIVQIEKQVIVTANNIQEKVVEHYLDLQTAHIVEQEHYVVPEKSVCYLDKPYAVSVEKPVLMRHQEMVVVERPETVLVKAREGLNEQIIKIVEKEKITSERESYPQPIPVPQHHYHIVYEQLPPKTSERQVMVTDEKVRATEVISKIELQDTNKQITTKQIEVPVHMERIFQKIMMLPQIVQVEKKIFMVEQINSLIAKQVDIQAHQGQYRNIVSDVNKMAADLLILINSNKQPNTAEFKKKLTVFLDLLKVQSNIPKIVETVKEIEVIKDKDRPVLVPVYDGEKEKVLNLIIQDLITGIKGINKEQFESKFPERVRKFVAADLGFDQTTNEILTKFISNQVQVQGKWKSWLSNYGGDLPNVRSTSQLTNAQNEFLVSVNSGSSDFSTLQANLSKALLLQKQRGVQIQQLKQNYISKIDELTLKQNQLVSSLSTQKYYKDLYFAELTKIKALVEQNRYEDILILVQKLIALKQETQVGRTVETTTITTTRVETTSQVRSQERESKIEKLFSQLASAQGITHDRTREVQQLKRENQRLKHQISQIQLNIPAWGNNGSEDLITKKINDDWAQKLSSIEINHEMQLNHMRQTLMKHLSSGQSSQDGGSQELASAYNELLQKYTELTQSKRTFEEERRSQSNIYEQNLKQLNKELITIRRQKQTLEKRFETQRAQLTSQYQRKLSTQSSNVETDLLNQVQSLKKTLESTEKRTQSQRKKLIEDYQRRLTQKQGTQGSQQRQLYRQLEQAKRNLDILQKRTAGEKENLVNQYERKLINKNRECQQYERKIKLLQEEIDRLRNAQTGSGRKVTSPGQIQQLNLLKNKIILLEKDLDISKKQIQSYQRSKLGQTIHTSITSNVKQSVLQGDFQSPQGRYKSGGYKFEEGVEGGYSHQSEKGQSRSSEAEIRRISKSGVRSERQREEGEDLRSQSSRLSGGSEGSSFKTAMTLREFMDLRKAEDKDQIITLVMIKVIEKIQQQADKGIINSYNPSNIFLSNFNPINLQSMVVRFGAPITNRKSKVDGLYLAPQILKSEGTTLKSVVFTLGVIWDELIHYDIYYKTVDEIQNLSYEYKVRDTSLNPILRNTLFEMMSKDPSKRLELSEAKRRLSLQRYIVSEGRAGTTTSRVSTQSRRNN